MLAGETLFGTFLVSPALIIAEVVARTGLDWVLVDLEHGTADEADLVSLSLAIQAGGAATLVRVESESRMRLGRALDRGVRGVMVPQVHTADQAGDIARRMRTQPTGERGVALFTRGMGFGQGGHAAVATAHQDLVGIVQIESREGLGAAAAMAATEGIDVLFVGPSDLSHALGIPGQIEHPDFESAVAEVAAAARAAGKAAGVLVWNPADVAAYAAMGYTFFALSSEAAILDRAMRETLASAQTVASAAATAEVV